MKKKFYIYVDWRDDDIYEAIFELSDEEAAGARKIIEGTPLKEVGTAADGMVGLSEGYDTLEEAEENMSSCEDCDEDCEE